MNSETLVRSRTMALPMADESSVVRRAKADRAEAFIQTFDNASHRLKQVRGKNTRPEVQVRKILHGLGLRFRLHCVNLPGKPDVVLAKHKTALFVHGCFWHRHTNCPKAQTPHRNSEFWKRKFEGNTARDATNQTALQDMGWRVVVIWECELRHLDALTSRLQTLFSISLSCDT